MDALAAIQSRLDRFIERKHVPHIIFHGAAGTGKRHLAHAFLARIYEGDRQRIKKSVMEVNCAHGKGIKFIREDLKNFARANIQTDRGARFKSIVLYNAEHLTIDAQSALRRCIEIFSHNTRFFIITENKHKLFNPVLSRFCEIYVPYADSAGICENLHARAVQARLPAAPRPMDLEVRRIAELEALAERDPDAASAALRGLAGDLYDRGVCAGDLVRAVKAEAEARAPARGAFSAERSASTAILFQKVKADFRNETFLMFYLLDFMLLRSNDILKSVTEM